MTLMNVRSMEQAVNRVQRAYRPYPLLVEVKLMVSHDRCCKQTSTLLKLLPAFFQLFMSSVPQVNKEISALSWQYEGITGYSRLH